jgi:hypothetical protein
MMVFGMRRLFWNGEKKLRDRVTQGMEFTGNDRGIPEDAGNYTK